MRVLEIGQPVFLLRFLPDSQRIVVGTHGPYPEAEVAFDVLSFPTGERVRLDVPGAKINSWFNTAWSGNAIAVHPSGESCYIAWDDKLYAFGTSDGRPLPVPRGVRANQVALSADGERLLAAYRFRPGSELYGGWPGLKKGRPWQIELSERFDTLAGFLPDGDRFVTIENVVRIRSFEKGRELTAGRSRVFAAHQPQISTDGRYLAALGYGNMYVWDLTTLAKPGKIGGTASFGDFRSCAIHPNGKTMAVIHGGPTLVKVYDLGTLKQVHKWTWKVGPLRSVAYSPDGTLGAAGSDDGRVVVWDVDE
jgi:WD40 repeat protein